MHIVLRPECPQIIQRSLLLLIRDGQSLVEIVETIRAGLLHGRRGVGLGHRPDQFGLGCGVLLDLSCLVLDLLDLDGEARGEG